MHFLIIIILAIWWIYALNNYDYSDDYKIVILYIATIIGGSFAAYLGFNKYYNNTSIEINMTNNYVKLNDEEDVLQWIDEHPDVKIISINYIDLGVSNEYVIFYQN